MNYKKMTKTELIAELKMRDDRVVQLEKLCDSLRGRLDVEEAECARHGYSIKTLQDNLRGERLALKRANETNKKLRAKISKFFSEVLGG